MRWCGSKENGISSGVLASWLNVELNFVPQDLNCFECNLSCIKKHAAQTQVKATSWWFLFIQD